MNKKAIVILGAIFLLIVGTLGFLLFQKSTSTDSTQNTQNTAPPPPPAGGLTPTPTPAANASDGNLVKLSSEQVVSPILFFDGTGVTYFTPSGELHQADMVDAGDGALQLANLQTLNIEPKGSMRKILWPPMGRDFIAEFPAAGGGRFFSAYSNSRGTYTDLPSQVQSLDWNPQGTKIYYVWLEGGKATLNISDPDTKNWQQVSEMWETDNEIDVSPDGLNILYYRKNNSDATNTINLTTPDGKIWRGLVKDGYNYGVQWSPNGQKFIFAKKETVSQKYQLWVYDLLSGDMKNLGLFTTTDKVVWDRDSSAIYAAVPIVGTAESGNLTQDTVYRINTTTLEKKELNGFSKQVDAEDLMLSKDSTKLFFRNGQDGYLYYLDLTK